MQTLQASRQPLQDLDVVTYEGQDPKRRQYREGFEHFMDELPLLDEKDPTLTLKVEITKSIMSTLAEKLKPEWWVKRALGHDEFERSIIAMESPRVDGGKIVEGKELIVAHWGEGNTSPVHGHAAGYMHEAVLNGKIRVNTYRRMNACSNKVRPVETTIQEEGVFVSQYRGGVKGLRQNLIHNFTALEPTSSLHYIPEHTRDGRDNTFEVEYFEDKVSFNEDDFIRIRSLDAMYLQKGEVVLVRSENVPEYGDHFIVITGAPVQKPHGLRPQDKAIHAPHLKYFLNKFEPITGLTLLKLRPHMKELFLMFHNIQIVNKEVVFPNI